MTAGAVFTTTAGALTADGGSTTFDLGAASQPGLTRPRAHPSASVSAGATGGTTRTAARTGTTRTTARTGTTRGRSTAATVTGTTGPRE
jgi:hypothetical protein